MAKIRIFKPDPEAARTIRVLPGAFDDGWMSKIQPCSGSRCPICREVRAIDKLFTKKEK